MSEKLNRSDAGDDTILTSSRSVMVEFSDYDQKVIFREADYAAAPADRGRYRKVVISRTDWEEMGSPDEITVTIEPGDHLNG